MRYLVCFLVACNAANATPSADETSPAGALDFDLIHRSNSYVIADQAYELTMPAKPAFRVGDQATPSGSRVTAMTAAVKLDDGDSIVLSITSMPDDIHVDANGLGDLAASHLKRAGATPTSDEKTTLAGLPARKLVGAGAWAGQPFIMIEYLALDTKHHMVVGITDVSARGPTPAFDAVRTSFKVKPGPAPRAPLGRAHLHARS